MNTVAVTHNHYRHYYNSFKYVGENGHQRTAIETLLRVADLLAWASAIRVYALSHFTPGSYADRTSMQSFGV